MQIWGEDVEAFRPERFDERLRHPFCFMPFSLGVRKCLGTNLAMLESRIVLATILRRYTISLPESQPPVRLTPDPCPSLQANRCSRCVRSVSLKRSICLTA